MDLVDGIDCVSLIIYLKMIWGKEAIIGQPKEKLNRTGWISVRFNLPIYKYYDLEETWPENTTRGGDTTSGVLSNVDYARVT